jgi:periplasmic protein TonB
MIARRVLTLLGVATAVASCASTPATQQMSAATNKDVRAYFDKVAAHVDRFRRDSLASALRYGEGKVVVMVRVARDGRVLEVEVRQSSGRAPIDEAEVNALWRASPLPPPPPEFVGDPVTLIMPINYKIAG